MHSRLEILWSKKQEGEEEIIFLIIVRWFGKLMKGRKGVNESSTDGPTDSPWILQAPDDAVIRAASSF